MSVPHNRGLNRLHGFTLIELLVTMGIIAVLIGILIPVLSLVRRAAILTNCKATQKQYVTLAMIHATEHRGYMPLDGRVHHAAGSPSDVPATLNDSSRSRYDYGKANTTGGSFQIVLLPMRFVIGATFDKSDVNRDLFKEMLANSASPVAKLNICPASRAEERGFASYAYSPNFGCVCGDSLYGASTFISAWVVNDAVSGFQSDPHYSSRCFNGNLSSVPHGAEVCLLSDGLPSSDFSVETGGAFWLDWRPDLTGTGAVTLADAFNETGKAVDKRSFDMTRHHGLMNVAFCDGHVEAVHITADDLAKVYLVPN